MIWRLLIILFIYIRFAYCRKFRKCINKIKIPVIPCHRNKYFKHFFLHIYMCTLYSALKLNNLPKLYVLPDSSLFCCLPWPPSIKSCGIEASVLMWPRFWPRDKESPLFTLSLLLGSFSLSDLTNRVDSWAWVHTQFHHLLALWF